MGMETVVAVRKWLGRGFILAALLLLFGVFDGLSSSLRKPETRLDILRGSSLEIIGKVLGNAASAKDLVVTSDSGELDMVLDPDLFKGFWMGDLMWRGRLMAYSSLKPGTYSLSVQCRDPSGVKPEHRDKVRSLSTYTVTVHGDEAALLSSQASLFLRWAGISPWWVAVVLLPVVLLSGMVIFLVSGRIDEAMAREGNAEVYRVRKGEDGLEIFFGLGSSHGLAKGEPLRLLDGSGRIVSETCAFAVGQDNSSAVLKAPESGVRPGYRVVRVRPLGAA
jgi:hypothetical protein